MANPAANQAHSPLMLQVLLSLSLQLQLFHLLFLSPLRLIVLCEPERTGLPSLAPRLLITAHLRHLMFNWLKTTCLPPFELGDNQPIWLALPLLFMADLRRHGDKRLGSHGAAR